MRISITALFSIEIFLDLQYKTSKKPQVRWLSYDHVSKSYQGVLEQKEKYVRIFSGVKTKHGKYDFSKLDELLKAIFRRCETMATSVRWPSSE